MSTERIMFSEAEGADDDQLSHFLTAIAVIDTELQRFGQLAQSDLLPDFTCTEDDLHTQAGQSLFGTGQPGNWQSTVPEFDLDTESHVMQMVERYNLTDFELAVILIGCLNSFEPRYRQLFSSLPFHKAGMPTVEMVLTLFSPGPYVRHTQLQNLSPQAPLLYYGLIEVYPGQTADYTRYITPDWVLRWLLGEYILPGSLSRYARWLWPQQNAEPLQQNVLASPLPSLLEIRYTSGADSESYLSGVAQALHTSTLLVSWSQLLADERNAIKALEQLLGIACLWEILLVFNLDVENAEEPAWRSESLNQQMMQRVTQAGQDSLPLLLGCLLPAGTIAFPFPALNRQILNIDLPDVDTRHDQLLALLDSEPDIDLRNLVRQVTLSQREMHQAVREAQIASQLRGNAMATEDDYRQAFLRRSRKDFGKLAQRITPQRCWDDIIISEALQQELSEIGQAIRYRESVLKKGFARKVGRATGISALFHGNPGTGKTLVAEVMAAELGVDLIRVDLSTVVNKYIGETEKNLGRIFDLAAQDAGVLFFDEADALFGKRSESKDARDRHANIEIAYLLQRLEQHPGLVILATNNRGHLDDAFTRRFTFITHFLWPDAGLREKMWRAVWPQEQLLSPKIDFSRLAQVQLTGANIRNISLLASWLAANAPCVDTEHIDLALRREMAKMGRNMPI